MPVHRTSKNGKPAYQWGKSGKKYTYNPKKKGAAARAKSKAKRQGRAARANGYK